MDNIVIIGSGNVAESLAQAVAGCGAHLAQVYARNAARAQEIAGMAGCCWACSPEQLAEADLYLLAVSDRAVAEVAGALPIPEGAAVAHTAGSVPLEALPARFARRAVFYPLQTFTKGRRVDWAQVPLFVEAATPDLQTELETFARKLSRHVFFADSARRAKLHLAAVFACNFANHMFSLGERLMGDAGLDFELLKPLVAETTAKALTAASPSDVQTGPAVRGDAATQQRHAAMLDDECLKTLYTLISRSIWETSRKI
ncbi:MAG: F420-dependent NADP oxidoreductase [Alistipes sp.]|nr:F420-dependent NADP oxidoreductase [Alistipes senegalensis]MCM1250755.1 F420-dependent NADP oxidoreductase [Alistipes sp.]